MTKDCLLFHQVYPKKKSRTACFIMLMENNGFFWQSLAYIRFQCISNAVQLKHSGFCRFLASTVCRGILEKVGAVRRVIGAREEDTGGG